MRFTPLSCVFPPMTGPRTPSLSALTRWMGAWEPSKAILDSCSPKSSCNIWWLGRGAGLKLGKLLWHPYSHNRWPFSSSGNWSATQADNCGGGRDHESRNVQTRDPKLSREWTKKQCWKITGPWCLQHFVPMNFLQLWSQLCEHSMWASQGLTHTKF